MIGPTVLVGRQNVVSQGPQVADDGAMEALVGVQRDHESACKTVSGQFPADLARVGSILRPGGGLVTGRTRRVSHNAERQLHVKRNASHRTERTAPARKSRPLT